MGSPESRSRSPISSRNGTRTRDVSLLDPLPFPSFGGGGSIAKIKSRGDTFHTFKLQHCYFYFYRKD